MPRGDPTDGRNTAPTPRHRNSILQTPTLQDARHRPKQGRSSSSWDAAVEYSRSIPTSRSNPHSPAFPRQKKHDSEDPSRNPPDRHPASSRRLIPIDDAHAEEAPPPTSTSSSIARPERRTAPPRIPRSLEVRLPLRMASKQNLTRRFVDLMVLQTLQDEGRALSIVRAPADVYRMKNKDYLLRVKFTLNTEPPPSAAAADGGTLSGYLAEVKATARLFQFKAKQSVFKLRGVVSQCMLIRARADSI